VEFSHIYFNWFFHRANIFSPQFCCKSHLYWNELWHACTLESPWFSLECPFYLATFGREIEFLCYSLAARTSMEAIKAVVPVQVAPQLSWTPSKMTTPHFPRSQAFTPRDCATFPMAWKVPQTHFSLYTEINLTLSQHFPLCTSHYLYLKWCSQMSPNACMCPISPSVTAMPSCVHYSRSVTKCGRSRDRPVLSPTLASAIFNLIGAASIHLLLNWTAKRAVLVRRQLFFIFRFAHNPSLLLPSGKYVFSLDLRKLFYPFVALRCFLLCCTGIWRCEGSGNHIQWTGFQSRWWRLDLTRNQQISGYL
jgi:hypothetical protein